MLGMVLHCNLQHYFSWNEFYSIHYLMHALKLYFAGATLRLIFFYRQGESQRGTVGSFQLPHLHTLRMGGMLRLIRGDFSQNHEVGKWHNGEIKDLRKTLSFLIWCIYRNKTYLIVTIRLHISLIITTSCVLFLIINSDSIRREAQVPSQDRITLKIRMYT